MVQFTYSLGRLLVTLLETVLPVLWWLMTARHWSATVLVDYRLTGWTAVMTQSSSSLSRLSEATAINCSSWIVRYCTIFFFLKRGVHFNVLTAWRHFQFSHEQCTRYTLQSQVNQLALGKWKQLELWERGKVANIFTCMYHGMNSLKSAMRGDEWPSISISWRVNNGMRSGSDTYFATIAPLITIWWLSDLNAWRLGLNPSQTFQQSAKTPLLMSGTLGTADIYDSERFCTLRLLRF